MRGEQQHRRAQLHLRRAGIDARHELQHVVVRARGRDRLQDFAVDHRLAPGALDVDHRRLAADRHRFLEGADPQIGIDRRGERSGQLDAVALDRVEAGQTEGDGIGARREADDPILARAIGYRRADFFSEDRAGHLDGDSGQDAARGVLDHPGNRRLSLLCTGDRWNHQSESDQNRQGRVSTHTINLRFGDTSRRETAHPAS